MQNKEENTKGTKSVEEESSKKKRVAEKEIRKEDVKEDDEDDEEEPQEQEKGTWKRADEATLAQRKKVKVRRTGSKPEPENAEAPLPLFPTFNFNATQKDDKNGKEKNGEEPKKDEYKSPFAQVTFPAPTWNFSLPTTTPTGTTSTSSSTTFTPFNTPTFTFATSFAFSTISSSSSPSSSSSIFGLNIAPPTSSSAAPQYEASSPSSSPSSSPVRSSPSSEKVESKLPSEPIKTGEEEEQHIFQTRAKLFVLDTKDNKWHERGVGQLKVNASINGSSSRLVMRVEGIGRLILNIPIHSNMKIEKAGDKAVRFIGASMDKEKEMSIYSIRVATKDIVEQFIEAVEKQRPFGDSATKSRAASSTGESVTTEKTPAVSKQVDSSKEKEHQ